MGIPAAEQRLIFQKFVRGSAAAAANVKGTGVGLAMVSHIVRGARRRDPGREHTRRRQHVHNPAPRT